MISIQLQGRLGNCMFQIATCIATAKRLGREYCIPENKHFPHLRYCTQEDTGHSHNWVWSEQSFEYTPISDIINISSYVTLSGYFQSEKYFNNYKEDIIKAFKMDDIVTLFPKTCSLHFRGTDYHNHPKKHPVINREYIMAAISYMWFEGYSNFMVFSDDIQEIKNIINSCESFSDLHFEYSEGKNEMEDLRLMASCASNIISNSSFSWWGAWCNPNAEKKIVAPSIWFGEELNHNTKDLIPIGWKII